jgi:hypothetical protein
VNSRGFAILLVVAVAASIACGLIVERYTAPGMERTFWFAVGLAAIIFPAGWYAERRGWVHGVWYGSGAARAAAEPASAQTAVAPATTPAAGTATNLAHTDAQHSGGVTAPATRPLSGESK